MNEHNSLNERLKTQSLSEMMTDILSQIKMKPGDTGIRELLFKLYCLDGNWSKALAQAETLMQIDEEYKKRVELYKNLVLSEKMRESVLAGERKAGTLNDSEPEWMDLLYQANQALAKGDAEKSEALRIEAFQLAPESTGSGPNTGDFEWIADSDGRIGPVCEFICAGGYRWVPFSDIQKIIISKPQHIIDLLWIPAELEANNEIYFGYIPARYPVKENGDQSIKLGHKTEWVSISESLFTGVGRKMLLTDTNEFSILDIEEITLS